MIKMNCRICGNSNVEKFLSLGETALANSYLSKEDLNKEEKKFPLELCFCHKCKAAQLVEVVPPNLLFKHYLYVSSTANTFKTHFTQMAEFLTKEFNLGRSSLVVDIGSNDGLFLEGFQKFGVKTIGIEPAVNIAKIAEQNGVETINEFFNFQVTNQIINSKGKADIVTANNVFAHIADIHYVTKNVKLLLKDNGIFVIEVAYLVDMLDKLTFDAVYHEHLYYYSLTSLDHFFKSEDMQIFKVQHVPTHGGSLRVFVKKQGSNIQIGSSVSEFLEKEKGIVDKIETYKEFATKIYTAKEKLLSEIRKLKNQGKTISGYGAPAKATTLLSFCGIDANYLSYLVDDNPLKQGLFMPGTHIPIVDMSMLDKHRPDYILILAWNFAEEILNKTKKYKDAGTKFIIPLPEPVLI